MIDRLYGGADDDFLNGGPGNDRLYGGRGEDELYGDEGNDWLVGGRNDDLIVAGTGNDRVRGGPGDDVIDVYDDPVERDVVFCGPGTDTVYADTSDVLIGCEDVKNTPMT